MGGRWRGRPARGAVVALVLVVPVLAAGCTIRARPEAPSTARLTGGPTTTVGTVRGTTVARRAFLLHFGSSGSRVRAAPAGPLPVAFGEGTEELGDDRLVSLVLVFPLLRSRPGCVRQVQPWLRVLRFDITALYRTWARGGPFPSQGRAVEPGTPLVVDVRPAVLVEPRVEARFAGLDRDRDTAPQLRWRVTRGC
jgi:hypothetical protein